MRLVPGDSVTAAHDVGDARSGLVVRGTDGIVAARDVGQQSEDTYTVVFTSHGFLSDTETTVSRLSSADLRKS